MEKGRKRNWKLEEISKRGKGKGQEKRRRIREKVKGGE